MFRFVRCSGFCGTTLVSVVSILGCGGPAPGDGGGNGDSRSFVEIVDPDTAVAAYVEGSSGEVLAAIAEKDSAGSPVRVTAAYYEDENGSSWTVFIGDNGLPTHMVSDGWTFAFDDYGNDALDVTITAPDGTSGFYPDIEFNTSHLAALESAVSARLIAQSSAGAHSLPMSKTTDGLAHKVTLSKLFDIAGAAVSLGTCIGTAAATIAASAGTFGAALIPGAAATSVSCFSAGVAIGNLFWGTQDSENLGTALSVAQCASGCPSLVFDVAGRVADAAETAGEVMTVDSDGDGIFDYLDLCDNDFDPFQYDTDGDGIGDACDPTPLGNDEGGAQDSDGDGEPDASDGCPFDAAKTDPGECGCGEPEMPDCGSECTNAREFEEDGIVRWCDGVIIFTGSIDTADDTDFVRIGMAKNQRFVVEYEGVFALGWSIRDTSGGRNDLVDEGCLLPPNDTVQTLTATGCTGSCASTTVTVGFFACSEDATAPRTGSYVVRFNR